MPLENSTLRQTVAKLIIDYGIRDYLAQFYLIHESSGEESGEAASEAEFLQRMMAEPDPSQLELEKLYKRTNPMIRETVRLLALISPLPEEGKVVKQDPTALRSFHGSLFQVFCQIRVNLRRMFEIAFDCKEDPDEFVEQLTEKYDLADAEAEAFTTDWSDTYETICQGLLDQSIRLTVFSGEDALFRLDDEEGNPAIGVPRYLITENQLIVSKDYFFLQILTVLKHVEVMAKISALEKGRSYDDAEVPITEMFEMDAVFPIAEAFMDRE
jgi:hypothetical protein